VDGYYYYGDTLLFGDKNPAAALEQYEKGIALDPTLPSGHFFAATALVLLHRPDDAREQIIKALTYYPDYEALWKIAPVRYDAWNIRPVVRYKFEPPAGYLGVKGKNGVDISIGSDGQWLGYAICKAVWANEPKFSRKHVEGGWSLEEERACVLNQLMSNFNKAEASLEKEQKKPDEAAILAAMAPLDRHLFEVAQKQMLDGYILFEIIGTHCPLALSTLDDQSIKLLDGYIRNYVIVAK
jgi:tetratricopeptide (TPR) repeat protein